MKKIIFLTILGFSLTFYVLTWAKEKRADFPVKPITLIVLTAPGGGWDTVCRIAAEYWRQYLPNKVPIVIKNVPGGEQLIGPTTLYNSAPDGYTVGTFSSGSAGAIIAGVVKFDVRKFSWIGLLSDDYYIVSASKKSGFKQFEDLKKAKKEILFATPGAATTDALAALLAKERMKLNVKMISHEGTAAGILAAIRGDVDLVSAPISSMKRAVIDAQDLIPLWTSAPKRLEKLPHVPTLFELGYPEVAKMAVLHRLVGAPPGVDPERLSILRKSFRAVLENPEYQTKVKKNLDAEINMTPGEQVGRIIDEMLNLIKPYESVVKAAWGKR